MSHVRILLGALATLALIPGCSQKEMLEKLASPEDRAIATQTIDAVIARKFDEIEAQIDPKLRTPTLRANLEAMANAVPPGRKPDEVTLVGASLNSASDERMINLTFQYRYGDKYFLTNCATLTRGNTRTIVGLSVKPLANSLEEQASFDLKEKSPAQYGVFLGALAGVLLSLIAMILCFQEKGLNRKWLWIIFIIFGIGNLSMNWSTGEWHFTPLAVLLFSAGISSTGYSPWVISMGLPIGAVVYLLRRLVNHRKPVLSNGD